MFFTNSSARRRMIPARDRFGSAWWLSQVAVIGSLSALACADGSTEPPPSCGDGKLDCGECTDVSSSLTHCGTCDRACSAGQDCVSGQCTCLSGLEACPSGCANLKGDSKNCGQCGKACDQGLVCSNGTCASSCGSGLRACGTDCIDTKVSTANCGDCGKACKPGQSCADGTCECTQGREECGGSCVDTSQDPLHCGGCDKPCPQGAECRDGACQSAATGTGGMPSGVGGSSTGPATGGRSTGTGGASSSGPATGGTSAKTGAGGSTATTTATGGSGTGGGNSSGCSKTGFYVENKKLYDKNCNEFVMRGVNYPYAWFSTRSLSSDFSAIAGVGANAVRVVMATGARWNRTTGSTLTSIINAAKAAKLVVVAEVHDTTGYSEQSGSVALSSATSYWTSSDITSALKGQEAFVIVNIGNEPNGNNTTNSWASSHVTSVGALRNAGLKHTLMVDAPNWGQDHQFTMRGGGGSSIWNADGDKNLVFSVHMYDVFSSAQIVSTYMSTYFNNNQAPLVVGEFAADHGSGKNIDEDAVMSNAEQLGVGYLGWSWDGNGSDLASLNITNNFSASNLTTWGNRLINGTNGIKATSEVCSCFN